MAKAVLTRTFEDLSAWHAFAEEAGMPRPFVLPNAQRDLLAQAVRLYSLGGEAHAFIFEPSKEIGLWVTPGARSQGLGTRVFLSAVSAQGDGQLYSAVKNSNPFRPLMERILKRAGFVTYVSANGLTLWRRRVSAPQTEPDVSG